MLMPFHFQANMMGLLVFWVLLSTVSILQLHPEATNSIPSKSHLEIDVRDIHEKRRNNVIAKVHQSAIEIAKIRGVVLSEFKIINQDPPALSNKSVINTMEFAAKQLSLEYKLMISRAYHDSLFMARISPMGMIFIPCYKGYSHKPEEYASPEDMANGVKVLALTMVNGQIIPGVSIAWGRNQEDRTAPTQHLVSLPTTCCCLAVGASGLHINKTIIHSSGIRAGWTENSMQLFQRTCDPLESSSDCIQSSISSGDTIIIHYASK